MDGLQQHVLLGSQTEQMGAQERTALQVEGPGSFLGRQPGGLFAAPRLGQSAEVDDGKGLRVPGIDDLDASADNSTDEDDATDDSSQDDDSGDDNSGDDGGGYDDGGGGGDDQSV